SPAPVPAATAAPAKRTRAKTPRTRKTSEAPAPVTPVVVEPRAPRRMVFIDVENTSSEADLLRVLDELDIRNLGATTELVAIGNWRVVGQGLARSLAQRGAHLVHSAPAARVSDWSDLWIAVHAGIWLGRAAPGDSIEIVSHDRAFDAVGDAATRLGVAFRRVTYRAQHVASEAHEPAAGAAGTAADRRRRRGGRNRRPGSAAPAAARSSAVVSSPAPARALPSPAPTRALAAPAPEVAVEAPENGEPHSATQEQIRALIAKLTTDPMAGVSLDRLTMALKAAGFQRPPGSPRLVTRLRRMSELEVLPIGRVRLARAPVGASEPPAEASITTSATPPSDGVIDVTDAPATEASATDASAADAAARRRPRRRGGRRRRGRATPASSDTPSPE
ncbi:MAG: hypothetical protein U0610_25300, partial [bacterium]